ncbi:MAG: sigma-70 family RNA polymerase sigma factor [Acidothermaceae bacterium]
MDDESRDDFAEFYQAELPRLVAQLYGLIGDRSEAEEAAQEAFIRAWTHWQRVSQYDDPRAWTLTVAHRIAVSRWRRSQVARRFMRRQSVEPIEGPGPQSVALAEALRQLTAVQRRAIVLHHLADRSVAEIAALDNEPEGTVKARLARGRTALAAILADSTDDAIDTPPPAPARRKGRPS